MTTPCYLYMEGATQGLMTESAFTAESVGNVYVEGHENEVLVQSVSHGITVPTDPQSGQPSGQCRHNPLTVTCTLNKSIPLVYNALVNGESLPCVEIRWYRTSSEGRQEKFYTDTLHDATITGLMRNLPHAQDESFADYTQLVDIVFRYRKLTMNHIVSGTSGSHDWRSPDEA